MKAVPLTENVYNYIIEKYVGSDSLLEELVAETEKLEIPLIQISPDQGKFLFLICRMLNAKNALEIGTLTGFSGIYIARGLSSEGKLLTVELEKKHADIAQKFFEKAGLKNKTQIFVSPALEQMKKFSAEKKIFDFIFIDADKVSYPDYYEEALKLSHSGTVIALDNMLKSGRVIEDAGDDNDLRAVQLMNGIISKDKRVDSLLVTIGDGLTLCVVK